MKFKELVALDDKALETKLKELKFDLIKENSQVASGTVPKSPGKIGHMKKTVARIKTLQNQRSVING